MDQKKAEEAVALVKEARLFLDFAGTVDLSAGVAPGQLDLAPALRLLRKVTDALAELKKEVEDASGQRAGDTGGVRAGGVGDVAHQGGDGHRLGDPGNAPNLGLLIGKVVEVFERGGKITIKAEVAKPPKERRKK